MDLALCAVAALAGACVQSAGGIGFALVLGPALFATAEPAEAVTALLVLGVALNVLVLAGERRVRHVRTGDLRPMLAAAVPGLVAGVLVLRVAPADALRVGLGVAVLAAVALQLRASEPRAVRPLAAYPIGALAGTLTTSTSVNGPPLLLWLQGRGAGPAEIRDTLAASFLCLNLLGAVAVAALGHGDRTLGIASLALLPSVVAGHALGRRAFARLHPRVFRIAGLVLAGLAGVASVLTGLV